MSCRHVHKWVSMHLLSHIVFSQTQVMLGRRVAHAHQQARLQCPPSHSGYPQLRDSRSLLLYSQ